MALSLRIFFIKGETTKPHCKKVSNLRSVQKKTNETTCFTDNNKYGDEEDKSRFRKKSFNAHINISNHKCPEIEFKGIIGSQVKDKLIATMYANDKIFFVGISDTLENMFVQQINDSGIALVSEKNRCIYRLRK
jgi:hypothetical protein